MNVLLIDNHRESSSWGAHPLCQLITAVMPKATCFVRRAPELDLPQDIKHFNCIVISGSNTSIFETTPWVQALLNVIQTALQKSQPILGICYGHQILALALYLTCHNQMPNHPLFQKRSHKAYGWTSIQIQSASPLWYQFPKTFPSFVHHEEEVSYLPQDVHLLASSDYCSIQAYQWKYLPVIGLQFHPEKTVQEIQLHFKTHASKPISSLNPPWTLYRTYSEQLIKNFFSMISPSL